MKKKKKFEKVSTVSKDVYVLRETFDNRDKEKLLWQELQTAFSPENAKVYETTNFLVYLVKL